MNKFLKAESGVHSKNLSINELGNINMYLYHQVNGFEN